MTTSVPGDLVRASLVGVFPDGGETEWFMRMDFPFSGDGPQQASLRCASAMSDACEILLVGDMFLPFDSLPVECFLYGDVGHRRGRRGTVPVALSGRAPDDVAGADLDDGLTLALCPAAPCGHDQGLA